MGAPVVHWEISAKDSRRLWDFYRSLFGWSIDGNNPMNYGLVKTGGKGGIQGGIGQSDPNVPGPSVTFYAEVDDPQVYLDKAESLGARVVLPVTEIPNMVTFAQFADPEGNIIGIVKSAEKPKRTTKKKRSKAAKRGSKGRSRRRR